MKVRFHPAFECECGWYVEVAMGGGSMKCTNPECPQYGKRFKFPTIELEEMLPEPPHEISVAKP